MQIVWTLGYVYCFVCRHGGENSMHLASFSSVWLCNICKVQWRKAVMFSVTRPSLSVSSSSFFCLSESLCFIGWGCTEGWKWSLGGGRNLIWGSLKCELLESGSSGGRSFEGDTLECWLSYWVSTGSSATFWTSVPATTEDNCKARRSSPLNYTITVTHPQDTRDNGTNRNMMRGEWQEKDIKGLKCQCYITEMGQNGTDKKIKLLLHPFFIRWKHPVAAIHIMPVKL